MNHKRGLFVKNGVKVRSSSKRAVDGIVRSAVRRKYWCIQFHFCKVPILGLFLQNASHIRKQNLLYFAQMCLVTVYPKYEAQCNSTLCMYLIWKVLGAFGGGMLIALHCDSSREKMPPAYWEPSTLHDITHIVRHKFVHAFASMKRSLCKTAGIMLGHLQNVSVRTCSRTMYSWELTCRMFLNVPLSAWPSRTCRRQCAGAAWWGTGRCRSCAAGPPRAVRPGSSAATDSRPTCATCSSCRHHAHPQRFNSHSARNYKML